MASSVQFNITCRIPSKGFCNLSTRGLNPSKQLCKFCRKQSDGYYCVLHERFLSTSGPYVLQHDTCVDATIRGRVSVDSSPLQIDPIQVARELIKQYDATVKQLMAQGYPRTIAEQVALKDVLGDSN